MSEGYAEKLAELKKLYENKILSKDLYEAAIKGLQPAVTEAQNTGSGAIAQDGSVASGEKGLAVGGSISPKAEQNIISGNNNLVSNFINLHWPKDEEGREQDKENLRTQLASYLKWMLAEHGTIELRGIKRDGKQVVSLHLETVYVPLAAVHGGNQHSSFELDRILQQGQHLVITGGPGCGKTTVLQHIAYTSAGVLLTSGLSWLKKNLGLNRLRLSVRNWE